MAKHHLWPYTTLGVHLPLPRGTHMDSVTHPSLWFEHHFIDEDH